MDNLSASVVGSLPIPLPTLAAQRTITDYLDKETTRIDALITAKKRLLELLTEKRRALITHAVTRGLDPNVPLRDSGVPWLGEIPVHWKVKRLKYYLRGIEQGWSPACESMPAALDEWGVMKAGCVNSWEFDPNENKRLPDQAEALAQYEIHEGDVLMSRANTTTLLGSTVLVREVRPRLLMCDKLYRLDVDESRLQKEFLVAFLRCPAGRYEFERDATGASNSMQNIGQDSVLNLSLVSPSPNEQRAIVECINQRTLQLDTLRAATERTIALLKERRAALISAAVTGQIDVGCVSPSPNSDVMERSC